MPYEAQANLEILESLRKEFLRNLQPFCEESSSSFKVMAESFLREKSLYGKLDLKLHVHMFPFINRKEQIFQKH